MKKVKVNFRLEMRSDGYPPIGMEILNGTSERDRYVTLANTAFFVKKIALGDTVECGKVKANGSRDFRRVHARSGNSALSVIFIKQAQKDKVTAKLRALGCYCEYGEFGRLDMLAVCVEKDKKLHDVISYLGSAEDKGWISYAELCIWD